MSESELREKGNEIIYNFLKDITERAFQEFLSEEEKENNSDDQLHELLL